MPAGRCAALKRSRASGTRLWRGGRASACGRFLALDPQVLADQLADELHELDLSVGAWEPRGMTQIHHIRWGERDAGPTDLANGVLLCTRCHHRIHDDGWDGLAA